ncbi:MAG: hypothetical protein L3J79_08620 [Candidatus Marinimicrobia bacterium]|nr:hypothetical protein [Candidatus Neomarinimicrobiota bacterium]
MDNLEKMIKEEFTSNEPMPELDLDRVLNGVHSKIKKRAVRRKMLLSVPLALLFVMVVVAILPEADADLANPGSELLMAGWEDSWTNGQGMIFDDINDNQLYEQSIDYLIDENFFSYLAEGDELLNDTDLKALIGYLEEV